MSIMTKPTWEDIERRLYRPVVDPMTLEPAGAYLHQAVTMVRLGEMTREEALITVALAMADTIDQQHKRIVDLLNVMPHRPVILPKT